MNDAKTKQQIVEQINTSTNVLVTVSNDPSVDELSAALALTIILNKLGKHTTAIFSGATPPAITFLDPQKTFEASTDSLRDFIIALNKEKADHLRYKVDGDVVKIFITPYRTTITGDDLEFSQGDYNVELVLALGVENQAHLDGALEAHGSILHDATVVTISAGDQSSSLGSIDWHDETASSLGEMLVELADSLKVDEPLVDQQVATALLTGIVAETDRFSNTRTSSKVMTIAAQLMAAGADQQLIAAKLQASHEIGEQTSSNANTSAQSDAVSEPSTASASDGFAIDHEDNPIASSSNSSSVEPTVDEPVTAPANPTDVPSVVKLADAYALDPEETAEAPVPAAPTTPAVEPLLGGVVTPPPVVPEPVSDQNKHSYMSESPTYDTPINGVTPPSSGTAGGVFGSPAVSSSPAPFNPAPPAPTSPTPAEPESNDNRDQSSRDDALTAVHATFEGSTAQPFSPAPGITLPPPPPLPDFGALPATPVAPAYALDQPSELQPAERLGDIFAPETPPPAATIEPPSNDPAQFRIPGQ